jgi:signal transduction histidine kinase/CheY-like chemotaxis protein
MTPDHGSRAGIAVDDRVLHAQVQALLGGYRGSFVASLLASAGYAVLYAWLLRDPRLLGWFALRLVSLAFYRRLTAQSPTDTPASRRWLRWYLAAYLYHGLVWALVPWLFMPADAFVPNLFTVLLLVLLCAGGLPAVVPRWSAVLAFLLPILLSLIGALLWRAADLRYLFLALSVLLYLVMALRIARQHHRLLTESLIMRFENQALTEQLSEQVQLARHASEEKTRFLAAASHDLRQPVHAIGLFGAVLERELLDHPQHANALRLMRAVDALGQSLDAMLDVSRLDAGVIEPSVADMPLNPVLQSLGQMFAGEAEQRQLQLRVRATPLWVRSDAELLQRLLANLIDNALKYSARGGVLVVARARGSQVWIDVVDTGIGIAAEHREQVFAEFFQVGNPGRDRSRGLGMGLSIVRRLSGLLGHPVQLHSRPGQGSRLRVVLPAAPRGLPPAPADEPAAPTATPGTRLLLVEDEDDVAVAMAAWLRAHGIELVHAATPGAVSQLLAQADAAGRPFDALICDLRLADGADGLALARQLLDQHGAALPTLLITGETAPEPLQRVGEAGLPVLFKPVTASALLEALARLLQHDP